MHITIVKTKDGNTYEGRMAYFRPSFNWFSMWVYDSKGNIERRFSFDDCESVITPHERINRNSPPEGEPCDEMKRAKEDLDCGREHGWTEDGKPYPQEKFDWEKRYENQG